MNDFELNTWILENIKRFKTWYHPVDFGDGIAVHCTDGRGVEHPAWDEFHGINKWEKMIRPYFPKIRNKRILDIGCNTGITDIHLAKKGAKEVIGIDKKQMLDQANFVKKALELRENTEFPVTYYECDVSNPENLKNLNLGEFDLVLALRVLYYFKEKMPNVINALGEITNNIIVQTNQEGYWKDDKWTDPELVRELLNESGFSRVTIRYPRNYDIYPVIIGKK